VDLKRLADPFRPDDIDWRVGQSGVKGNGEPWAKVLAYVTNRAIQQRLDDVCGPEGWRNEFREWTSGEPGVLCGLAIRVDGEWVTKWDGAEQTDIEKVKGGLSNAMKRAGYQWGIGRYLYDLPEGFARIVAKGTRGAHYAQAKSKDGQKVDYYWLPPELPRWAQPTEAPDEVEPEPVKVETKSVAASQPPLALVTDTVKELDALLPTLGKNVQTWARNKRKSGTSDEEIVAELKRRGLVA
jgi:hypothetical protein